MSTVLVAGAGGFIGGHLTKRLLEEGHQIIAADVKPLNRWYQFFPETFHIVTDLGNPNTVDSAVNGCEYVFNLAADMGGMGFIENNKLACMLSVLPSTHLLKSSAKFDVKRFFYASSACVYAEVHQLTPDTPPLKETHAYPAQAEDGYGWEKLFTERMCRHFREDAGLETRIARYHNVYGPNGTWDGGREKAPAAICRKVIEAVYSGSGKIEIWGDGEQTRTFMYVDDCVEGTLKIMNGDYHDPLNLGSAELVSINQLVTVVEQIAGVQLFRSYNPTAPQGVRGRSSDNTLIRSIFNWEPSITLQDGMEKTYQWIWDEHSKQR